MEKRRRIEIKKRQEGSKDTYHSFPSRFTEGSSLLPQGMFETTKSRTNNFTMNDGKINESIFRRLTSRSIQPLLFFYL